MALVTEKGQRNENGWVIGVVTRFQERETRENEREIEKVELEREKITGIKWAGQRVMILKRVAQGKRSLVCKTKTPNVLYTFI